MRVCMQPPTEHCISGGNVLNSDVARYAHAAKFGGVYHDDDAQFIKQHKLWPTVYPHLPWRNASLVIGIEFPRPYGQGPPGCCLQFVQWSFACKRGSLIMESIAKQAQLNLDQNPTSTHNAVELTGPLLFTQTIYRHMRDAFILSDVEHHGAAYRSLLTKEIIIVLPYRAFGIHWAHSGSHIRRDPSSDWLVRHKFKGRWRK